MQEKYWLCRKSIGLQEQVLTMKEDKDIMRAPGHCTVTASHRIMVEHSDATRSSMLMEHPSGSWPRSSLAARAPSTEGQADMLMVQPAFRGKSTPAGDRSACSWSTLAGAER